MKKTTDQIMPSLYFRLNVHSIGHQATLGYNVQSKVAIVKTMCLPPTYNSKLFSRSEPGVFSILGDAESGL